MFDRSKFSTEQWSLVTKAPLLAGTGVSALDWGVGKFAREFKAMTKTIVEAQNRYADNSLLKAVLEEDYEQPNDDDGEKLDSEKILLQIAQAARLVDAHAAPNEAKEFKDLLVTIAERTAEASSDGFLGFGSQKVSAVESDYLAKLRTALGLPS